MGAIRTALAVSALATCAAGQAPEARVGVECPALDAEHRAALEARAKSGLIVRGASGTLQFECRAGTAAVSWTAASAAPARDTVALPADSNLAVETLLEVAERLFTRVSETPPAAPASTETLPPPPGEANPPVEERPPSPPPPVARPPAKQDARSGARGVPFSVAAGAAAEYWDAVMAVGPGAIVGWHALDGIRIAAGVTVLFATEERLQIAGRLVRLHGGAEIIPTERVRLGASAILDAMTAIPEAALDVPGASDVSPAARLHAAYALPLGSGFSLVAGPFAGMRAEPVRVVLGTREAFRIPVVTGGLEVQIEWDAR